MSAELVAAKAVGALATDKRGRTILATLIASVLMIIFIPLIVFMGVMVNLGEAEIDTEKAQQIVIQNLSTAEKRKLTHLESVMNDIAIEFQQRNMNSKSRKAQALYVCALYDAEQSNSNFVSKLADCYENSNTDDELRSAVLSAFDIQINAEEFDNLMSLIRNTIISVDFEYPDIKNNLDLVKWAEMAYEDGWGYVWGSYGKVLDEQELNRLISVFGSEVSEKEEYIRTHWLGRRTADCVGLIKGYGWYDDFIGTINYRSNGMNDVTASGMYAAAVEKGSLDTMPDIPGIAIYREGHIGVYVGNGYVIHAANTYDGVIKTSVYSGSWTNWLKVPYITYIEEGETNNE